MPAFFLTEDNCEFVKRQLRRRLTSIKSAHLTEALAAAFGFRTHAALRSALALPQTSRPPLIDVNIHEWSSRLHQLGYESVDPQFLVETVRAHGLPIGVWREFRNGDRTANSVWFYDCRDRDIPNVYIELRTKYAKLNWDCISLTRGSDDHVQGKQSNALLDVLFKRYQALAKDDSAKSMFTGSAFVGWIDRLSPHIARAIADDFFGRLYLPLTQQEPRGG